MRGWKLLISVGVHDGHGHVRLVSNVSLDGGLWLYFQFLTRARIRLSVHVIQMALAEVAFVADGAIAHRSLVHCDIATLYGTECTGASFGDI